MISKHQQEGIKWMAKQERFQNGGILADEPGLGKTVQVILTMLRDKTDGSRSTLILLPKALLSQWEQELTCAFYKPYLFYGSGRHNMDFDQLSKSHLQKNVKDPFVVLSTYGAVRKLWERSSNHNLFLHKWHRLVCDEAHELSNEKTQAAMAISKIRRRITWLVTGTPMINRINNFFALLSHVTQYDVKARHFSMRNISPTSTEGMELCRSLRDAYFLRRKRDELEDRKFNLPPNVEREIQITLSPEEQALYNAFMNEYMNAPGSKALAAIAKMRSVCQDARLVSENANLPPGTKLSAVITLLQEILRDYSNDKVILFSQWTSVLDLIEPMLQDLCIAFLRMDGTTSPQERRQRQHYFNTNQRGPRVLLCSLRANGCGLNLQAANHVILIDPYWHSSAEEQAIARVHRCGQQKQTYSYRFIVQGQGTFFSVEERIKNLQNNKVKHYSTFLDNNLVQGDSMPALKLFLKTKR